MASVKITVTVPDEQLATMRNLVTSGQADSVSGFVQHAVSLALDDVAGWQRTLDESLEATGGPLTPEERTWADEVLRGVERTAS